MERKNFEPTTKQIEKWNAITAPSMPSDGEFKAIWKRQHHNTENGWGMGKRAWVVAHADDYLTCTVEYNLGVWQGRIDAFRGNDPLNTPAYHTDAFQYGYSHGFAGFAGFWKGYDRNAQSEFGTKYSD